MVLCVRCLRMLQSGVIWDKHGTWILGFFKYIGCCLALSVELWGALEGFQIAWSLGLLRVVLEVDSLTAIHLIKLYRESSTN